MGWPKGKSRVTKEESAEVKLAKPAEEVKPPISNKPQAATTTDNWAPGRPDMGEIQGPPTLCACNHLRKFHYGGVADWCNVSGCNCQAWKQSQ